MKRLFVILACATLCSLMVAPEALCYPPAVGILSKVKSCKSCHVDNGPWGEGRNTIIDIIDKETMKSLRQKDGSFLLEAKRGHQKTVLTVIGRMKDDTSPAPYRNAWLYIDTTRISSNALSKFPQGWDVNLPMACRVIGDKLEGFDGANVTALPMTIQPLADAKDAELQLQVMLTKGESVKGNAKLGMLGNYFERKVWLKIVGD